MVDQAAAVLGAVINHRRIVGRLDASSGDGNRG
jgi:hypothetical protein